MGITVNSSNLLKGGMTDIFLSPQKNQCGFYAESSQFWCQKKIDEMTLVSYVELVLQDIIVDSAVLEIYHVRVAE